MKYALIQSERSILPVKRACQVLRVSTGGFYAWQQREATPKSGAEEERLVAQIISVFEESRRQSTRDRWAASAGRHL